MKSRCALPCGRKNANGPKKFCLRQVSHRCWQPSTAQLDPGTPLADSTSAQSGQGTSFPWQHYGAPQGAAPPEVGWPLAGWGWWAETRRKGPWAGPWAGPAQPIAANSNLSSPGGKAAGSEETCLIQEFLSSPNQTRRPDFSCRLTTQKRPISSPSNSRRATRSPTSPGPSPQTPTSHTRLHPGRPRPPGGTSSRLPVQGRRREGAACRGLRRLPGEDPERPFPSGLAVPGTPQPLPVQK